MSSTSREQTGAKVVRVALWMGIVLLLAYIVTPWVTDPGPPYGQSVCHNNMKNIALALDAYANEHGHFPPAFEVRNGHKVSWRVLLLPYLDRSDLFRQYDFNEPWDGPNNSKLGEMIELLICPSDPPEHVDDVYTSYLLVTGEGAIFNGERITSRQQVIAGDGVENTLLLVEVAGSNIHWMEPRDLDLATMSKAINANHSGSAISSNHLQGVNMAFANARVRFFSEKLHPEILRALITYAGGEEVDDIDIR